MLSLPVSNRTEPHSSFRIATTLPLRLARKYAGSMRWGGVEHRRFDTERAGEFGDDRAVLLQYMHRRGRRRVDAFRHHWAAQFEDPRIAGAAADHFEDALGVEPGLGAEHDRLRGRC